MATTQYQREQEMTDVNPAIISENYAQKTLFVNARNNHLLNTYLGKSGMGTCNTYPRD